MNSHIGILLPGASVILFSVGLLASCASGGNLPGASSEFRIVAESLEGHDSNANYDVMHALFAAGRSAIPALVEVLDIEDQSWIHCGSFSLHSETIRVDFDSPDREGHVRFVGEIALYLIESILRSDIYFAQTCSLEVDGNVVSDLSEIHEKIELVASSLRAIESSELENISLQKFRMIMRESGLGFPQGER